MADLIGQSLGRYHILEQLGEGGMATVFKAYDTRLECDVAIKFIRTEKLPQETLSRALARFEREAKAQAILTHPNIIKVIDYGDYEGRPYLVMPCIRGGSLKERIANKRMGYQEAARLLLPIAKALDYAHKHDIIHRDIKPSNILLTEDGEPMLADFGIAKIIEEEATVELTSTGMTIGTPEYMAPEQVTSRSIDLRADIYSLGVVFYEMVTGRKPFIGDTPMGIMLMHASQPLPRPSQYIPGFPANVEQILLKALAKKPEARYQKMSEFIRVLDGLAFQTGQRSAPGAISSTSLPKPPTSIKKKKTSKGRFTWLIWLGIGGIILVMAVISLVIVLFIPAIAIPLVDRGNSSVVPTSYVPPAVSYPTATPQTSQFSTRIAPSPTSRITLFSDDFSDPESGWEVGDYGSGSVGYENGSYFVIGTGSGVNMYGAARQNFSDVIISVVATAVQGPSNDNNGYGIVCRKDPDPGSDDGYYLRISADGYYSITKADDSGFTDLVSWTESSVILKGDKTNTIVAYCVGGILKLEVNGQVLAEATDYAYSSGDIALMAVTYEENSTTKVLFDDLVVWQP